MADDAFSNYVRARAAFARAEQDLDRAAPRVHDIARKFAQDPRRFGFARIAPALPADVLAAVRSPSFDRPDMVPAHDWPSAAEIQQPVVSWHGARAAVEAAYRAIPKAQRDAVAPPQARG